MSQYQNLKNDIQQYIKNNYSEEITGDILQQRLINMITALGKGYQFIGVVVPNTEFTPGDEKIVAIGFESGTYTDFGGVELEEGKFAIFTYDGEWGVSIHDFVSQTQLGLKQDKTDNSLTTSSKQVVGAINENKQRIDNLFAIGRYLAIWNAKTGLPTSNPSGTPYPYKAGDWFLVGIIADEGGTNYMPNGTEYTGEASTTPYVDEVPLKVGDRFFFDGTTWKPLVATYPEDNNVKYDEQELTDEQKLQARTNIGAQERLFERGSGPLSIIQRGTECVASNTKAFSIGYRNASRGEDATAIGSDNSAFGFASFASGYHTSTNNSSEVAMGRYNVSHQRMTSFGNEGNTLFSLGNGQTSLQKKNAFEIMQNGDVYVLGLGGYDGTNAGATGVLSLQAIINAITI